MISVEKWKILTPFQKLSKNVGDLGKLMLPQALKSCPKCNKLPNQVTLQVSMLTAEKSSSFNEINWREKGSKIIVKALSLTAFEMPPKASRRRRNDAKIRILKRIHLIGRTIGWGIIIREDFVGN